MNITRDELREIERLLSSNGWVLSVHSKKDSISEYVKGYDNNENVVGIEIALTASDLGSYEYYGVCCVQLVKYYADMPYIRDDLRAMETLISRAEDELLKVGIPFRPTYGFGNNLERSLGTNLNLREKYHLAEFEKEDLNG